MKMCGLMLAIILFIFRNDVATCVSCPAHSNATAGSSAVTDCQCNAGFAQDGSACAICTSGTYKTQAGNEACTPCSAGKYSAASTDCSIDDCIEHSVCIVEQDSSMRRSAYYIASPAVLEEVVASTFVRTAEIYSGKSVWQGCANNGTKLCWFANHSVWNIMTLGIGCNQDWYQYRSGFITSTLVGGIVMPWFPNTGHRNVGTLRCGSTSSVVCLRCPSEFSSSPAGSTAIEQCTCIAGFSGANGGYGYLTLGFPSKTATIIALVPGSPPRFASLSARGSTPLVSASLPSYNAVGGPGGKGDMSFDQSSSQYLDGGAHTFNMASSGGFTAVTVVKFTGSAGSYERIFDFDNGVGGESIILSRFSTNNELLFKIFNGATACDIGRTQAVGLAIITQDAWITIIARYNAQDHSIELMLNGVVVSSGICSQPLTDRLLTKTYVGKSHANHGYDDYLSGSIAGLFIVDTYMDTTAATLVADAMARGDDVLSTQ